MRFTLDEPVNQVCKVQIKRGNDTNALHLYYGDILVGVFYDGTLKLEHLLSYEIADLKAAGVRSTHHTTRNLEFDTIRIQSYEG